MRDSAACNNWRPGSIAGPGGTSRRNGAQAARSSSRPARNRARAETLMLLAAYGAIMAGSLEWLEGRCRSGAMDTLTQEQLDELREDFDFNDANRDGRIQY